MGLSEATAATAAAYASTASLAISAVQTASSMSAQRRQAQAQQEAILREQDMARMDNERQANEASQQASSAINAHAMKARSDLASFDALIGEGGGGVTAQRWGAAIGVQQGQNLATITNNADKVQDDIKMASLASKAATRSKLASIEKPSSLQAGLAIGAAGATYANRLYDLEHPKVKD